MYLMFLKKVCSQIFPAVPVNDLYVISSVNGVNKIDPNGKFQFSDKSRNVPVTQH